MGPGRLAGQDREACYATVRKEIFPMTSGDDDAPRQRPRFTKLPIDGFGVDELEAYIAELRAEIARVEADIARKQDFRSAAAKFFRT
jgi:uncharacterized small protein (DUF1192 family)